MTTVTTVFQLQYVGIRQLWHNSGDWWRVLVCFPCFLYSVWPAGAILNANDFDNLAIMPSLVFA